MVGPLAAVVAEPCDDLRQIGPFPIIRLLMAPPNVQEAGDTFICSQPEACLNRRTVRDPFGNPARSEAKGVGRDARIITGRASRQNLLPLGRFAGLDDRNDGDHQRRPQEATALKIEPDMRRRLALFLDAGLREHSAGLGPCVALKHDKTPGRHFFVVRNPRPRRQNLLQFGCGRRWPRQFVRLDRTPGAEKVYQAKGHAEYRLQMWLCTRYLTSNSDTIAATPTARKYLANGLKTCLDR
jgi:hypothetical protein